MNKRVIMSSAALVVALAISLAFVLRRSAHASETLVNVGGNANQCECSKRIER